MGNPEDSEESVGTMGNGRGGQGKTGQGLGLWLGIQDRVKVRGGAVR